MKCFRWIDHGADDRRVRMSTGSTCFVEGLRMQRWIRWVPAIALVASLLFTVSCSRPALWVTTEDLEGRHIQILLEGDSIETLSREALPTQIPAVPVREKLRPCCAFGRDLKVRLGAVPIPGFKIGNIMSLGELGPHLYDSGVFTVSNPQVNRRTSRQGRSMA